MAEERSNGPSGADARAGTVVIVPRRPGPLRVLGTDATRQPDELDALIDELFGATTDERPGLFDVGLVVVGALLMGWALLTPAAGLALPIGVASLILGLALPARALVRRGRGRRQTRRERHAIGDGTVLDTSHPAAARLVGAYESLVQAARLPGVRTGPEAVAGGHLALSEAASLLAGRAPSAPEQVRYVLDRRDAIRDLTRQLQRVHEAWQELAADRESTDLAELAARQSAIAAAREQLEAATGLGSLPELQSLTERLRQEADDVRA